MHLLVVIFVVWKIVGAAVGWKLYGKKITAQSRNLLSHLKSLLQRR